MSAPHLVPNRGFTWFKSRGKAKHLSGCAMCGRWLFGDKAQNLSGPNLNPLLQGNGVMSELVISWMVWL
jgi:hypothetical protein